MLTTQICLGLAIAAMSTAGLIHSRRVLVLSHVVRRLAERRGEAHALMKVRSFFVGGIVFGIGLALRVVNPLQW